MRRSNGRIQTSHFKVIENNSERRLSFLGRRLIARAEDKREQDLFASESSSAEFPAGNTTTSKLVVSVFVLDDKVAVNGGQNGGKLAGESGVPLGVVVVLDDLSTEGLFVRRLAKNSHDSGVGVAVLLAKCLLGKVSKLVR